MSSTLLLFGVGQGEALSLFPFSCSSFAALKLVALCVFESHVRLYIKEGTKSVNSLIFGRALTV